MAGKFQAALTVTLRWEGGYVNHPQDPGGPTNKGVTQRVYDAYRRRKQMPTQSVRGIEDAAVQEIYREQYWNAVRGDDLPPGLDLAVFDFAVNSGTARAIRYLQRVLGVQQDGHLGEVTLARIADQDARELIRSYMDARLAFVRSLPTWRTFGKGWQRRIDDVRRQALRLAAPGAPQDIVAEPRADEVQAMATPPERSIARDGQGAAAVGTGALAGIGAVSEIAKTMNEAGTSFAAILGNPMVLVSVAIIGLALAIWLWRLRSIAREAD